MGQQDLELLVKLGGVLLLLLIVLGIYFMIKKSKNHKKILITTGLISLIFSIWFNIFSANNITSLIISITYVFTTTYALVLLFTFGLVHINKKWKSIGKVLIIPISILIVLLYLFVVLYMTSQAHSPTFMCFGSSTPHLVTNIFTGECSVYSERSCRMDDPWYLEFGCSEDKPTSLDILKKSKFNKHFESECNKFCTRNQSTSYCADLNTISTRPSSMKPASTALTCQDIVTCPSISCNS